MSDGAGARQLPLQGVSHSLIDQALLSISNFLIGLAFIKFATKHNYYAYSQLIGYVALTLAIQAALINTTALTLLPQKRGAERVLATNVFFGLQLSLSMLLAVAGGLFLWLLPAAISMEAISVPLGLAMVLMVLSSWLREFLRNVQFINMRADLCLRQDMAYVFLLTMFIGGLVFFSNVQADDVLLVIAFSGIVSALPWLSRASIRPAFNWAHWSTVWREIWPLARWSLPAGLVTWSSGNGYLLIGAAVLGPESTAEIVAAKLFMAPLGTIFLSWGNIFRPKVSHWISLGARSEVVRLTRLSILGVAGVVFLYFMAMLVAYPLLDAHVLGDKYKGLRFDIAWWGVFFVASGVSSISNGVLFAGGHFRRSFYAAVVSCTLSIPVMYFSAQAFGKDGLMFGAVLGESAYAALVFWGVKRMMRGAVIANQSEVMK